MWAVRLPRKQQLELVNDISSWWRRRVRDKALLKDELPDQDLTAKIDETIASLICLKRGKGGYDWFPGLSLKNRGALIRIMDTEAARRRTSQTN